MTTDPKQPIGGAGDLRYLLNLGVPITELARRTGRSVTAIRYELNQDQDDNNDE